MSARRHIIPIFVPHYGCPHDCVFCNQKFISGTIPPLTASDVLEQIEKAFQSIPHGTVAELAFYGGSFTAIPVVEQETFLGAIQPYLDSGDISSIRVSTRPDAIDESVLDRLRKYGVGTIELGAQSMNDEVLLASGRGHFARDVIKASLLIKEYGFHLILQMMTGLPGDTDDGAVYTANSLISLKPNGVRIYPTVVVKDTALHGMWLRGDYKEHTVEDAVRICSKLVPMFEKASIPIIRLGLNASEELSGGAAVAGAYHPALGELVLSRVFLNNAREILHGTKSGSRVTLGVHPGRVSVMIGQGRQNIHTLINELGLSDIEVVGIRTEANRIVVMDLI